MDYPWAWPSPRSYLSQGFFRGGVGTSRVRLLPTGTGDMALKPPFSYPYYCFGVPGSEASLSVPWPLIVLSPPQSSLPEGIGGWQYRRLNLATPTPDDTHTWRRPKRSTLTFLLRAPLGGSCHMFDFDFDFGQRPRTGRYTCIPTSSCKLRRKLASMLKLSTKGTRH